VRVWIVSALIAAVGVAVALRLTKQDVADDDVVIPRSPAPLSDQEVRDYIAIVTARTEIIPEGVGQFRHGDEEHNAKIGQAIRDRMNREIAKRHLTPREWSLTLRRVEYIVDLCRRNDAAPERASRHAEKLQALHRKLEDTKDEILRQKIQKQIDHEEALKSAPEPPALEADKQLVRRYWTDLDKLAPRRK